MSRSWKDFDMTPAELDQSIAELSVLLAEIQSGDRQAGQFEVAYLQGALEAMRFVAENYFASYIKGPFYVN